MLLKTSNGTVAYKLSQMEDTTFVTKDWTGVASVNSSKDFTFDVTTGMTAKTLPMSFLYATVKDMSQDFDARGLLEMASTQRILKNASTAVTVPAPLLKVKQSECMKDEDNGCVLELSAVNEDIVFHVVSITSSVTALDPLMSKEKIEKAKNKELKFKASVGPYTLPIKFRKSMETPAPDLSRDNTAETYEFTGNSA